MSAPGWDGLPLNPERDGWHWLRQKGSSYAEAWEWSNYGGADEEYQWQTDGGGCPDDIAPYYDYLGPCILPADHAVAVQAAVQAEREAAAAVAKTEGDNADAALAVGLNPEAVRSAKEWRRVARYIERNIRARGDTDALAHSDDVAVSHFAAMMRTKMADARAKGRGGWDDPSQCTTAFLADLLIGHCSKSNAHIFVDIANLAMMLHLRGATAEVSDALARMIAEAEARGMERALSEARRVILEHAEEAIDPDDLLIAVEDAIRTAARGKGKTT